MHFCIQEKPAYDPSQMGIMIASLARDEGITQLEIASALSVNQSQVSRIFRGKVRRHTNTLMRICEYVVNRSASTTPEAVRQNDILIEAVADVWDGTEQDARALAAVIRSLRMLRRGEGK